MSAAAQTLPHDPGTERPAMTAQTTVHSPARINPDRTAVLAVVLVLIAALIGASAALSYAGLSAVAAWAGIAAAMAWLVPVFIEGAILAYTGAGVVHQARGEKRRAQQAWSWVTLWTLVSAAANGAHAWDAGPGGWQGLVGVALAALFPIGVLIAVHTAAGLIVAKPDTEVASDAETDGRADARMDRGPDVTADGRTPDPLAVLEEIEQAASPVAAEDERRDELSVAASAAEADGHADTGTATVRPPRRPSVSVEAVRPEIERLAREGTPGREIARQLGIGRTRACEIVRELRTAGIGTA